MRIPIRKKLRIVAAPFVKRNLQKGVFYKGGAS